MDHRSITDHAASRPSPGRRLRRGILLGAVAVPLALGAAGLSRAGSGDAPAAKLEPTPIGSLATSREVVAAKGEVAEIYGNKFVVRDGTGRALVETGPRGEDRTLVKAGETVTVQGRFEHGFLHAAAITRPDGSQVRLGPAGGPPPGGPGRPRLGQGQGRARPQARRPGHDRDGRAGGLHGHPRDRARAAPHRRRGEGQDGLPRALHVDVDGTIRDR